MVYVIVVHTAGQKFGIIKDFPKKKLKKSLMLTKAVFIW